MRDSGKFTKIAVSGVALGLLALYACGKKDKGNGGSIGAPQAYPPTALVTPSSLVTSSGTKSFLTRNVAATLNAVAKTSGLNATTALPEPSDKTAVMNEVKNRLFSEGPTNMLKLVKNVDNRMKEYDSRVSGMETAPSCLSSTPVDVSSAFSVPAATGTTTFPLFGQCQETMSPGLTLMFGKKDNDWYLVDGANKDLDGSDNCVMTMAKISGTSDADRIVDAYMAVVYKGLTNNFTGSSALMHFKANVAAGTLELTAGGVNIGGEQIHAKTNATHVYVRIQSGMGSQKGTLSHACFSATDLSNVAIADCSALESSLELVSLGAKANGQVSGGGSTYNIPGSDANNVDLTTVVPNFCGKLSTAFTGIPAFGG
jgi:hypothetical protein